MNQKDFWILAGIALSVWLLSKPNCQRGCRTVAEHLLEHELAALFA